MNFPRVELLRTVSRLKKRKENPLLCFHFQKMTKDFRKFHVVVMQFMSKKCTCCGFHPSGCISSLLFQAVCLSEQKE